MKQQQSLGPLSLATIAIMAAIFQQNIVDNVDNTEKKKTMKKLSYTIFYLVFTTKLCTCLHHISRLFHSLMIDIKLTYVQEEFTVVLVSGLCYDKNAVAGAGAVRGGGRGGPLSSEIE